MTQAKTTKQPLEDSFLYTVTNIDGVVKRFISDESFLEYVKAIYKENEEGQPYPSEIHWLPENIQQAKEYIHEYCSDLTLEEHPAPDSKEGLHTHGWELDDSSVHGISIWKDGERDNGTLIASVFSGIEDAELIVKAVNSYNETIKWWKADKDKLRDLENERKALLDSHRELKMAAHNALMTLQALRDIDKSIAPQTIKELETALNNAKNI